MKKFTFPLEGLLRVRKVEADQCRGELQRRLQTLHQLQQEIVAIAERRAHEQERLQSHREGELDMGELVHSQRYLNQLQRDDGEKRQELVKRHEEAVTAQRELASVERRLKVVERLRERQYEEYREKVSRAERLEIEEASQALRGLIRGAADSVVPAEIAATPPTPSGVEPRTTGATS